MNNLFVPLIQHLTGQSVQKQNLNCLAEEIASAIVLGSDLSVGTREILFVADGINLSCLCDLVQSLLDKKNSGNFLLSTCDDIYLNTDAAFLLKKSNSVILVETRNHSYVAAIDRKIKTIESMGATVLGFVLIE